VPRLTPIPWKVLECIFLEAGFSFERRGGGHRVYVKPGVPRPVIIPTYRQV
jgi:predicted RNA binding protein YcfA (HicA-like mRNA interferase family)